ncbi:MAG: hypothetical protein QM723_09575 [Myxococcaceae bacterium]
MSWVKWKLMVTTLPIVGVIVAVKVGLEQVVGWPGIVDFSEVGIVLTAGVFLTGFMLAGVMADYKESEKLPGDLASTLETLEDIVVQACAHKQTLQPLPLRRAVADLAVDIRAWLFKSKTQEQAYEALTRFGEVLQQLERDGGGAYASRAIGELHNLRKTITRIGVISRTGFLPPAYALLETLNVLIVVLLVASKFKSVLAEFILVPFVTLIYVYMLRLIKDIDDPFEYSPDGKKQGGAEVELFPLEEFRQRIGSRLK